MNNTKREPIDKLIGRRIREFCQQKGMAEDDIAELLKITTEQFAAWMGGRERIPPAKLSDIAHHLGVDVKTFFTEDQPDGN